MKVCVYFNLECCYMLWANEWKKNKKDLFDVEWVHEWAVSDCGNKKILQCGGLHAKHEPKVCAKIKKQFNNAVENEIINLVINFYLDIFAYKTNCRRTQVQWNECLYVCVFNFINRTVSGPNTILEKSNFKILDLNVLENLLNFTTFTKDILVSFSNCQGVAWRCLELEPVLYIGIQKMILQEHKKPSG